MLVVHRTVNKKIKLKKMFSERGGRSGGAGRFYFKLHPPNKKKFFGNGEGCGLGGLDKMQQSYIFTFRKVSNFLETEQPKKSAQIRGVKSPFTQEQGG